MNKNDTRIQKQPTVLHRVGAIGLIAIVLLDTGVIKLAALDSVNKLMVSIVMGLVFLIFLS